MSDFNSTELEAQSGEQAGAVAPQEENPTEAAGQGRVVGAQQGDPRTAGTEVGEDKAGGEPAGPDGAGQDGDRKKGNTQQENAAIRAARLRARREAMEEAKRAADEAILNSGVINPYTEKPFASMKEFEEYGQRVRQAKLARKAKETGRSVEELSEEEEDRAFLSRLRKSAKKSDEAQQSARARREFIERDALDFVEKHPEVDVEALDNNKTFRRFCGSRYGNEPLSTLYEDFVAVVGKAGEAAVAKAGSKTARSTGSGTAGGVMLSPSQKKTLDAWNAEHPEMAMTAKEFLGR